MTVPAMLRYEKSLPQLPVNPLVETSAKWLDSVRFATSNNSPDAPVSSHSQPTPEFLRAQQVAEDFVASPTARELQSRLKQRAEAEDNWLSKWWNHDAYLAVRDPLYTANYFYAHNDDKSRKGQALRAASLIRALYFFRRMVASGVLEPEMVRTTPLAMSSYEYLFNAARLPHKDVDTVKSHDMKSNNYIIVMRQGKFYEVSIVDSKGEPLSQADLQVQFQKIIDQAGDREDAYPVGALTTENRDIWAQARSELTSVSSKNAHNLDKIDKAIIVLCLDSVNPATREQVGWNLWIGDNHFNRWMDKHELIVTANGKSGFNGEHSAMDGTPTCRLNDWMCRALQAQKVDLGNPTPSTRLPELKELKFQLNDGLKRTIDQAKTTYQKTRSDHEMVILHYEAYGKNAIKKFKTSPDSWAQLVMQLAYYKMEGKLAATYESAQTRKFKLGRTEVIRSATPEALEWCKAMESPSVPDLRKLELLRRAANAHIKYAQMAAEGKGIDRHLYGLKKLLKDGETLPALYSDPAFAASSNWTLSTSNLSSECFSSWGYCQVVEDGFGLAYSVNNDSLRWCITTKTGKARTLAHYIQEAATEVREAMESAISDEAGLGKSKL